MTSARSRAIAIRSGVHPQGDEPVLGALAVGQRHEIELGLGEDLRGHRGHGSDRAARARPRRRGAASGPASVAARRRAARRRVVVSTSRMVASRRGGAVWAGRHGRGDHLGTGTGPPANRPHHTLPGRTARDARRRPVGRCVRPSAAALQESHHVRHPPRRSHLVGHPRQRFRRRVRDHVRGVHVTARVLGGSDRVVERADQPGGTRRRGPRVVLLDGVRRRLGRAGTPPERLDVSAEVTFEKLEPGWRIVSSALTVRRPRPRDVR